MNNLTTRKIVLGLLVTLVLAFGVQGIADAIDRLEAVAGNDDEDITGDLGRVTAGQPFTIQFTVGVQEDADRTNSSNQRIDEDGKRINSDGYKVADVDGTAYRISAAAQNIKSGYRRVVTGETRSTVNGVAVDYKSAMGSYVGDNDRNVVDSAGRDVYTDTGLSNRATADPDAPVAVGKRSHFNEEAIKVSVSGGGAKITTIGTRITPATSHTLKDGDGLTGAMGVIFSTSSAGEVTITISDETPTADLPNGSSDKQPNLVFTVYVIKPVWQVSRTATLSLRGVTNGVGSGFFDGNDQPIYNGDSNHYEVRYTSRAYHW